VSRRYARAHYRSEHLRCVSARVYHRKAMKSGRVSRSKNPSLLVAKNLSAAFDHIAADQADGRTTTGGFSPAPTITIRRYLGAGPTEGWCGGGEGS